MKMLLSVVAVAGLSLSCDIHQHVHAMMAQDSGAPKSAATAIAGQWQMSVQTPHGPMKAGLQVKQDSTNQRHVRRTTWVRWLTGTVDGKKFWVRMEVQAGQKSTCSGKIDGKKMSGTSDMEGGEWSATRI
jgi:hypothetical protein